MYIFFFFFVLLIFSVNGEIPVKINAGAYIQRLPNMTFYETNVPLLIELDYRYSNTWHLCKSHLQNPDLYNVYFPPFGYFYNVLSKENLDGDGHLEELVHDDGEMWTFPLITRTHVKDLFIKDAEAEYLMEKLGKQFTKHTITINNNDHLQICNASLAEKFVQIQAVLQEQIRQRIMEMCRSKKLDPSLIPTGQLQALLQKMKLTGSLDGYITALKNTRTYYSHPLVECIISPVHVAFGIHVPLIRKGFHELSLHRILTPSFAWYEETCSLNLEMVELAVRRDGSKIIIKTPKCDPFRDELCLITEVSDEHLRSEICAKLIIQGASMIDFTKLCPLVCKNTGDAFSYLTAFPNNRILITHVKHPINISCVQGSNNFDLTDQIGLLDLEMPCGCTLRYGERQLDTAYPCTNDRKEPVLHVVLPAAWSSLKSIKIPAYDENPPSFVSLEECLDANWKRESSNYNSVLNISAIILCIIVIILMSVILLFKWRRPPQLVCQHQQWIHVGKRDRPPQPLPRPMSTVSEVPSSSGYMTPTLRNDHPPTPLMEINYPHYAHIEEPQDPPYDTPLPFPKPFLGSTSTLNNTSQNTLTKAYPKNAAGYVMMDRR